MSCNTIGKILKLTTWGESHGKEIGAVLDGVPPNIKVTENYIQKFLDRRAPGSSKFVTQRKEKDKINILSGVFEGYTTGTPISLVIKNTDHKSKDYGDIKDKFRPAHADYTYFKKYGIRDYRGGGRSSARETAMRVAAGAIARLILGNDVSIVGAVTQLGIKKIKKKVWDNDFLKSNSLFCPDQSVYKDWEKYLTSVRKLGSSCGALVEIIVKGVPAGIGEPIYGKLDAELASALMGINAVKGVEIGSGFKVVSMSGETNSDEISINKKGTVKFLSNNAGGILGGISSGQDILCKLAVKPTSSILAYQKTIDINNSNTKIRTKGRHDPCVGIRCVPVAEAMVALVLADQVLRDKAQNNNREY
ncbi:chorismate synthase [Alphaproteobacteria bacterium]|nr:chorismate synthase [Alphaproteobacteria bacterium]